MQAEFRAGGVVGRIGSALRTQWQVLTGLDSRAGKVRVAALIGMLVAAVFSLFNILTPGMRALGLIELGAVLFLLLPAAMLCRHEVHVPYAEWLITAATACILGALIVLGGVEGTGLFWAYLAPQLAFFIKGQKKGWRDSLVFLAAVGMYLGLHPPWSFAYAYTPVVATQFMLSLLFYTLIASAFNVLRERYAEELQQRLEQTASARQVAEAARHSSQQAFDEAEQVRRRMDQIIWSANLGTWEMHLPTRAVVFNARCAEMLGRSLDEMGGPDLQAWVQLEHPQDLVQARAALVRCLKGQSTIYEREGRMRHANGDWVWVMDRGRVVEWTPDGKALRMAGTRQDITARKNAEALQLQAVLQASPDAILLVDEQGAIQYANTTAAAMFGYPVATLLTMGVDALVPAPQRAAHAALRQGFGQGSRARAMGASKSLMAVRQDGREFPIEVGLSPFVQNGQAVVIATITDITERVAAQHSLLESEIKLRKAQEIAGFGNYVMDLGSGQWESSQQLDAILGIASLTPQDRPHWRDLLLPEFRQAVQAHFAHLAQGGAEIHYDYQIRRFSDGQTRWITANGEIERDASGKPVKLIGTIQDITERKEAEGHLRELNETLDQRVRQRTQELGLALEHAEMAKRSRGEFLANMSHEIRTPMNAVLGMVYLALKANPPAQQREYLEKIKSAGSHLLGVINDILDFSKIDAGRLDLELSDFDLGRVLQNVLQLTEGRAREKGLRLRVDVAGDVPQRLCGDSLRLGQIIINYVNNAIKFTEAGQVSLLVSRVDAPILPAGVPGYCLRFAVSDTGIGISPEQQARLFNTFEQADNSTTRKFGGSGLGLSISKQLAALMGGEVGVNSALGQGSTFWFTAQLQAPRNQEPQQLAEGPAQSGEALRGSYMLVVDDSAFNLEVAKGILEGVGVSVMLAHDGVHALQILQECQFDCVLMDVHMPVMDGLEATRSIRADARLAGVPVIGLTANANSADHARCVEAGMNAVLTKPIEPENLFATLGNHVVRGPAASTRAAVVDKVFFEPSQAVPELPVWDARALPRAVGNSPALHKTLLRHFLQDANQLMPLMEVGVANGRYREAAEQAHKLKSSARTVGAMRLGESCDALEQAGRSGDAAACGTLVAQMRAQWAAVEELIRAHTLAP